MPTKDIRKLRAHWKVHEAIRSGRMVRQPCSACGAPEAQAHHEDYDKPLDVVWLCVICHNQQKHPVTEDRVQNRRSTMEAKGGYHKHDAATRQAIGAASKARIRSEETKRKTSESIKAWHAARRKDNS